MRKLCSIGAVLVALLFASTAQANSVGVGPCTLQADNVTYSGSTGTFVGGIISYCNSTGNSFPMDVEMCEQRKASGGSWTNMSCASSGWQTVPTTYYKGTASINCGVWHRVYAWASVKWLYLTWQQATNQVWGNASLRC